ncbi:uncharacterized protein TNCV_1069351 [Trichonephila clavipes]|nr:uncharacterized protein TNCV_1069351 [Trichonephila clavipes]
MLSTTILQLMLKDFCNWTRQNPSQKNCASISWENIYDPVGFLSPYTIRLKCLLQELWLRKLSWDDELPPDIHAVWSQWWLELPFLSELKIPRKRSSIPVEIQVKSKSIPFSDASQKAYGAAAFLRVKHKDRVSVDLVTSKSRVAPLKRSPLHWIKGPSHRWKPFVANRVREIQSLTDPNSWFHCSGKDNPADLFTRGISVDALTTNSKWWNGSSFLRQIDFQTKGLDEAIPERVYLTEMRKNSNPKEDISLTLTVTKNNFLENIIDISNNYVKLIRVEVSHAENWLIHSLHEREFYEEMRKLLAGEPIPMKSKLTPLNVFLDESNIIREPLVLIKDENLPSTKWSTGRITEIFHGTDGKVRVVNLQVAEASMQSAALEEVTLTNSSDIIISGDGTWKTRGYSSRVGVCAVIGDKTGKCIDAEVMSSFCKGYDSWKRQKGSPAYKKVENSSR